MDSGGELCLCPNCAESIRRSLLALHLTTTCTGVIDTVARKYPCPVPDCAKTYSQKKTLEDHYRRVHGAILPPAIQQMHSGRKLAGDCPFCRRKVVNLQRHMAVHARLGMELPRNGEVKMLITY